MHKMLINYFSPYLSLKIERTVYYKSKFYNERFAFEEVYKYYNFIYKNYLIDEIKNKVTQYLI